MILFSIIRILSLQLPLADRIKLPLVNRAVGGFAQFALRLLLPIAMLTGAVCLLAPVDAFAAQVTFKDMPYCGPQYEFSPVNMRTFTSWIFAVCALLAAIKNFRASRKKKEPVDTRKISIDVIAALVLGALPFAATGFSPEAVVVAGAVVALAGGWLCFRLVRSVDMPTVLAAVCAIGFTLLLVWPLAYLDYQRLCHTRTAVPVMR